MLFVDYDCDDDIRFKHHHIEVVLTLLVTLLLLTTPWTFLHVQGLI